jgi:hypothetical protein
MSNLGKLRDCENIRTLQKAFFFCLTTFDKVECETYHNEKMKSEGTHRCRCSFACFVLFLSRLGYSSFFVAQSHIESSGETNRGENDGKRRN